MDCRMSMKDDAAEENGRVMLECYAESRDIAEKIGNIFKEYNPSLMTVAFALMRIDIGLSREESDWAECQEVAFEFAHDNFDSLTDIDSKRDEQDDED